MTDFRNLNTKPTDQGTWPRVLHEWRAQPAHDGSDRRFRSVLVGNGIVQVEWQNGVDALEQPRWLPIDGGLARTALVSFVRHTANRHKACS